MRLEFVESEDDLPFSLHQPTGTISDVDAWRPNRMGLGYTVEMQREKLQKEQEKLNLERKLLGLRRKRVDDSDCDIPSLAQEESDADIGKCNIAKKKVLVDRTTELVTRKPQLSQSQKKRLRQKNKDTHHTKE